MAYTTIDDPSEYFQTALYTGNGGDDRAVTNDGNSNLQPDFLWFKTRSESGDHNLVDSVRGANKLYKSNEADAEETVSNGVQSFTSDGFTVNSRQPMNKNNVTYACWQWKETATAGFDIVLYTGNGSNRTISHSLSAVPSWMIVKNRSSGTGWQVYHGSLGGTKALELHNTGASFDGPARWNNTAPTSSVFSIGTDSSVNTNTENYIAYLFAEKKGYSKFGSYAGNSNADGPFIFTGFKPAWVMVKTNTTTQSWQIYDNKRDSFNQITNTLFANENNAEATNNGKLDFLSNGFKLKDGDFATNKNGESYIFFAFAENPFVTSTGVPTTAR